MSSNDTFSPNPELDLTLERLVDLPATALWAAWTTPELLLQWFTPAPWQTVQCQVDLRPGGEFRTVMRGPQGQEVDNSGCFLVVDAPQRLVWTGALGPGWRPRSRSTLASAPFLMTAILEFEARGAQTLYRARVLHGDAESRQMHAQMGFHAGWGAALDQLVALMTPR